MEVGQCRLKLSKEGSDIPLQYVTPAEVLVLRKGHEASANGNAIKDVSIYGTTKKSDREEVTRLARKYANLRFRPQGEEKDSRVVPTLFPGDNPKLPKTFAELGDIVVTRALREQPKNYAPDPKDVILAEDVQPDLFEFPVEEFDPLSISKDEVAASGEVVEPSGPPLSRTKTLKK